MIDLAVAALRGIDRLFRIVALPGALSLFLAAGCTGASQQSQPLVESRAKPVISAERLLFRDLNGDGSLDPYEDWRLPASTRADDLVARMTLAEKAGAMVHATLPGIDGMLGLSTAGYDLDGLNDLMIGRHISSYLSRLAMSPYDLADQSNRVQELAEHTRLGVPVTISSDPRHHFQFTLGASARGPGFAQWPEPLGFAALRDPRLLKTFADIVRREYRAIGLQMALSPQADLATEPRWPRQYGTFGSNAELTSKLVGAYVAGFQGGDDGLADDGVVTVVKHWVGYGAAVDGFDGHSFFGRYVQVDGDTLQPHVDAFAGALAARTGGVMSTYSILLGAEVDGEPVEQVGAGFNRQLLTNLLREQYGYEGILLSDWRITWDCTDTCLDPSQEQPQTVEAIAMPWGVEELRIVDRFVKGVEAGLDQFGGTDEPHYLIEAAESGLLSESRIDASVKRIMIPKFEQGLFENPYVDPAAAAKVAKLDSVSALADKVQREAQVLLQNQGDLLPIAQDQRKVFLFGMNPGAAEKAGLEVVADPSIADFAIIRTEAPSEMHHPHHFFGQRYIGGRLDFRDGDPAYEALKDASAQVPTVFAIYLKRPAVLTNVRDKASVILANFGASDAALLDVVMGRAIARGRLPFELPSSMLAVEAQHPAIADDSPEPLYPFGAGIVVD